MLLETWKKFVLLSGTARHRRTRQLLGPIRHDPDIRAFFFRLIQKTVAVARPAEPIDQRRLTKVKADSALADVEFKKGPMSAIA
jgi:hypothetical protein